MWFKIVFIISILTICSGAAQAQTAPDLGILWQKENIGIDVQYAKFSKDGQFVYCATETNIVKMYAETGEILSTFDKSEVPPMYGIYSMEISGKGNFITTLNGYGNVVIWDTRTEKAIKQITFGENSKDSAAGYSVISPDEKYLLIPMGFIGSNNIDYLKIFEMETYSVTNRIEIFGRINILKFSHDGKYFATGITYRDNFTQKWFNKLVLWETATLKEAAVLEDIEGDLAGYRNIVFSFDDSYIGTTRNILHDVHIFSLQTKKLIKTSEPSKLCGGILFLPDNLHFLLTNYDINSSVRTMELHDFEKMIKVYPFYFIATLNVYNDNGYWKIFGSLVNNIALITNKPNNVIENETGNPFRIYYDKGSIILEANTTLSLPIDIKIYDLLGNVLYSNSISEDSANERHIINIDLPSGIYLAKVIYSGKEYSKKFNVAR